jgi:hypothetical protein
MSTNGNELQVGCVPLHNEMQLLCQITLSSLVQSGAFSVVLDSKMNKLYNFQGFQRILNYSLYSFA